MGVYRIFVEKIVDPLYTEVVLEIYFKCISNENGDRQHGKIFWN